MCLFDYWNNSFVETFSFLHILVIALLICGIVYLVKNTSKQIPEEPKKNDEALVILRKRYASGEINAEEFAQKKKDLEA